LPSTSIAPVKCARCREDRWPFGGVAKTDPFVCQRCREVLAGRPNVRDPASSEAAAAWTAAGRRVTENPVSPFSAPKSIDLTAYPKAVQPASSTSADSRGSTTVFRDGPVSGGSEGSVSDAPGVVRSGRAGRSGRPRVDTVVQRRKAADRAAAYRAKKKSDRIVANDAALAGLE
jgi:hypothetical protein